MHKVKSLPITAARIIVTCPGRNFVTLKLETAQGVHGIGDATLNGRELAVASYLADHVIPCLIGRDAHQIEDIWQFLYRGAYWRRGPVTMSAIAAVDTALWDIKAKVAGMPLYQLLGGACRTGVRVYGHANGETVPETIAEARRYQEMGYTAIRLQSGVPGLSSTYGVSRDKMFYEPANGGLPRENLWSSTKYLAAVPALFEAARAELGWDIDLLHDSHHRLTPIEAARLGKDLEPYKLFWLEDTVAADNQASFRLIRQHTTTPLCTPAVSATCGAWRHLPIFIMSKRVVMERRTCRRFVWQQHCTSICRYQISAFKSTCATPARPTRYSRTRTGLTRVFYIPAMRRVWASISMRNSPRDIRINVPIFR